MRPQSPIYCLNDAGPQQSEHIKPAFVGAATRLDPWFRASFAVAKHLDDLRHNLKLSIVRAGQGDRLEVGVDRVQADS